MEWLSRVQYARMLLIFSMVMMYSLSCPLITPFGKYWLSIMLCQTFMKIRHNIFLHWIVTVLIYINKYIYIYYIYIQSCGSGLSVFLGLRILNNSIACFSFSLRIGYRKFYRKALIGRRNTLCNIV